MMRSRWWLRWAQFVGVMLYVLVAGVMWGTWLALARTMTDYDATTFLTDGRHMIANLATPMAVLMVAALVVGALVTGWLFWVRSLAAGWLSLAGWLMMLTVLIVTVAVEVPIDELIVTWTEATLPADWLQMRARWAAFHTVRTFASLAGVAAAVGAALVPVTSAAAASGDRRESALPSTRS